jgi:hypothetical protein
MKPVQKSNMGLRHVFYTTTAPARGKCYPALFLGLPLFPLMVVAILASWQATRILV